MNNLKTNKEIFNALINKANKINEQLKALQLRATELINECVEFGDKCDYDAYEYELKNLTYSLNKLIDLEIEGDIPEKATNNF